MLMETVWAGSGSIEVMFLRQRGDDPFVSTPERRAQIGEVASRIARFISEARSTLDIAIYDFRLHDEAAAIIADALRERAKNKVVIRIIYDATTEPDGETVPAGSLAHLEADKKAPGTETFVRSFADIAQIKGITGYRVLVHRKNLVVDRYVGRAWVLMGFT